MSEENKHTPGPWIVRFGGGPSDDGFGIACNNAAGPAGIVAECWPAGLVEDDRKRIAANAKLIATAPDLLDACRKAWSVLSGNTMTKGALEDALMACRDAIAKAEGSPSDPLVR